MGDCSVLGQRTEVEACARVGPCCASGDATRVASCVGGDLTLVPVAGSRLSYSVVLCGRNDVNANLL